jgi:hypothetical protein
MPGSTRVKELSEEGEGDVGDLEGTLVRPNDESIIELFGNTKCRQIPWLSIPPKNQSHTPSETKKKERQAQRTFPL